DGVVNQIAKMRYMFGSQFSMPLVIRTPAGAGLHAGPQHSQSLEAWFAHIPGLKPFEAAPAARPMIAASLIGVSITRSGPKRSTKPRVAPNAPPGSPTSSPTIKTFGSLSISSPRASFMAHIYLSSLITPFPFSTKLLAIRNKHLPLAQMDQALEIAVRMKLHPQPL
ncbi:hypothetical protein DRN98_02190, partial [Methanosarcinales archaeon]